MKKEPGALLIVDVQIDFCPGGALPVAGGDTIIPVINRYAAVCAQQGWPVFASRDWHPAESRHFAVNGGTWPVHCVADSAGAQFHPALKLPPGTGIISKGMHPDEDGYSAFQGFDTTGRSLHALLGAAQITRLYVCGLATDYCVKNSVLDACRLSYDVGLLMDAVKGLDADGVRTALAEMVHAEVELVKRFEELTCRI